jgi:hypothetical protein
MSLFHEARIVAASGSPLGLSARAARSMRAVGRIADTDEQAGGVRPPYAGVPAVDRTAVGTLGSTLVGTFTQVECRAINRPSFGAEDHSQPGA